jgi:hypothetical protein
MEHVSIDMYHLCLSGAILMAISVGIGGDGAVGLLGLHYFNHIFQFEGKVVY